MLRLARNENSMLSRNNRTLSRREASGMNTLRILRLLREYKIYVA